MRPSAWIMSALPAAKPTRQPAIECDFESEPNSIAISRAPGEGQWKIEKPLATMFVWAPIPEPLRSLGSLEFAKRLMTEAKVAVSPGLGFGETGEGYVRFALVENRHRIRQAVRGIRRFLREAGV